MSALRIAFAGDRDISVWVLKFILSQNVKPLALLVPEAKRASHADALLHQCPFLASEKVLRGSHFRQSQGIHLLEQLDLDYIISIHFPYIYPESVLSIPRIGVLNLHPAYLPYGRGWHTASWAILEGTPVGATLHFVDNDVDTGDIVHQETLDVSMGDTAHALYAKLKKLELKVFEEAWPELLSHSYRRIPQNSQVGTFHRRKELTQQRIQRIDLNECTLAHSLIRRLRALTTNRVEEAAYFEADGKRHRIQVFITEDSSGEN